MAVAADGHAAEHVAAAAAAVAASGGGAAAAVLANRRRLAAVELAKWQSLREGEKKVHSHSPTSPFIMYLAEE